MKIPVLSLAILAVLGIPPATLADDYQAWVTQGYRWSLVSGLHAYRNKDDAKNERSRREKKSVSEEVRYSYYLRPGKVVLVVATDAADGLSQIRMGGISSDLWTPTKYLSKSPVKNSVGKIETPGMAGILPVTSPTPALGPNKSSATSLGQSPSSKSAKATEADRQPPWHFGATDQRAPGGSR
ncbi:MAG: hypothetical protein JO077_12730 [Verrucomicrobia bacterium]|nr:hypothetical protein [Verrucomicrobiota bacterium]